MTPAFVDIRWGDREVRIEYAWIEAERADAPVMVFLHEGLGSLAMWRDYPQQLCAALGVRGLVYSRPGYGRSPPLAPDDCWAPDYMHHQANEVLPALLQALGVRQPPWLLGHSDGGSIALIHAASHPVAGLIVLAPHIKVEDISVTSIEQARQAYLGTDLGQKLSRYHDDPDATFWRWNRIWLDPGFRDWTIEAECDSIGCPVLAIQGVDDEYGTLEQIRGIARRAPQTRLVELPACGHSPHRDQPQALTQACLDFFHQHKTHIHPVH